MRTSYEAPRATDEIDRLPILDPDGIEQLEQDCGTDLPFLMRAFIGEARARLQRMTALEPAELWREAHTLIGSASFYACPRLAGSATALEVASAGGRPNRWPFLRTISAALESTEFEISTRYPFPDPSTTEYRAC